MDNLSDIATARDDGRKEGKEEGLAEGKLEEKRQIGLNMKNKGLDNEFIAKCLNISIKELNKLLNS